MSTTQFGGPGSAFSFAAPTRPSRRANSSNSFKDAAAASPTANGNSSHSSGPAPVDPPAAPSLANGGALGEANGAASRGKPFVYTREFLLSLYDEEKAKKRPLELAAHETATRELTGSSGGAHKPWLLQEYREGEKELFVTSIHPANNRPSRMNRNDSSLSTGGANGPSSTLDLSTLGTLPRDRDRALGSPSLRSPSIEKEGLLGSAGRERRTRERSSGATMGIMGGVLGGIAANTPTRKREESCGSATKEGVWQGGRWRRNAQEAEEAEKQRSSAFGSRRFPPDDSRRSSLSIGAAEPVAETWEDSHAQNEDEKLPQGSAALNGTSPNEANVTASVLGSLALDSDPVDDPLLRKPSEGTGTPSRIAPPPGLGSLPPKDVMWQYRDPSGQVQGPFAATMMHDWYRQQFFTPDLRVKRVTDAEFESLENLVRRTGDSERPFLAPSPQAIGTASAFSSAPGTPRPGSAWGSTPVGGRAQTPLEQFTSAVSQSRFGVAGASSGSPFYEPFGSASASPAPQAQTLQQSFSQSPALQAAIDPWGAPLSSAPGSSWNGLAQQQQQQPQTPSVHAPLQSPMDILRQLTLQQHGLPSQQQAFGQHGHPLDAFGRPSPLPASPFFDPSHLAAASPTAWIGQQLPQQQAQQAQHPWASLTGANAPTSAIGSSFAPLGQSPAAVSSIIEPIGTPSAQASAAQSSAAQLSPWGDVQQQQNQAPVVEVKETVIVAESETPAAPVAVAVVEEVKVEIPAPKQSKTEARKSKAAAKASSPVAQSASILQQVTSPAVPEAASSPTPTPSAPSKAAAAAPWAKEDVVAVAPVNPSPSLREIQEAEAREAAKRKEAARIQAAQANIQAAQRAAALEAQAAAESLPPSASWAAGPAQVPAPRQSASSPAGATSPSTAAPWSKPAATPVVAVAKGQKTLKEIQEEEERQKKAKLAAHQQQQVVPGLVGRGYAGSVAQAVPASNSPWTTVAAKPTVVRPAAPVAKPVVPGLPTSSTSATSARTTGSTGIPVKPAAPAPAVVRPAAPAASTSVKLVAARSVNVASPSTAVYDLENPPPPSPEFLSWTKQALKGLNVPLEEFVQMLLSFPLEASADVLEIISDSVYANSSTLDGRRFANDFTTRRKNDVAVRYPSIFAKGAVRTAAGKPSSMAAVLASAPAQPQQEWNVKVSAKKKKGGK
ncbi:kinesin-like protein [Rhodotorula toruloides]